MRGGRWTFDFDGWCVAAGLHDAAEEDGDVAGWGLVSCCSLCVHMYLRLGLDGLRDVALLEYGQVLRSVVRQVPFW